MWHSCVYMERGVLVKKIYDFFKEIGGFENYLLKLVVHGEKVHENVSRCYFVGCELTGSEIKERMRYRVEMEHTCRL